MREAPAFLAQISRFSYGATTLYHAKSDAYLSRDMLLSTSDAVVKEEMQMGMYERGQQLRGRNGHFEMAAFELKKQPDGFWMWVSCDFDGHQGGHWLAPDPQRPNRLFVTSEPYLWPTALEAYAARDRWDEQDSH